MILYAKRKEPQIEEWVSTGFVQFVRKPEPALLVADGLSSTVTDVGKMYLKDYHALSLKCDDGQVIRRFK